MSEQPRTPYRILSLDGGGTWALVQVRALQAIFGDGTLGHDVLRAFHLVAANSGGSTIAASLAVNQPLSAIAEFLLDPDKRIPGFRPTWTERLFPRVTHALPIPRYTTRGKRANLLLEIGPGAETALSEWRSGDASLPDLLIAAFDYESERAAFFRTNGASRASSSAFKVPLTATLLDAAHASTTAPIVYFDTPAAVADGTGERKYWDGAIAGYNNPAMAAVVEALANGMRHEDIALLSIGTGSVRRPPRPVNVVASDPRFAEDARGAFGDLRKASAAILDDPPDAATFMAHVVLGGQLPSETRRTVKPGPVVRMCPVVRPLREGTEWRWPACLDAERWARLTKIDMAAIQQGEMRLIDELATEWIAGRAPNQPIRSKEDMAADIGDDTFPAALDAVRKWLPGGRN